MNVFRNPNLRLRAPPLIAPSHSCCNAKVMVDSFSGVRICSVRPLFVLDWVGTFPQAPHLFLLPERAVPDRARYFALLCHHH
jgi:hypothetical protein